MVRGVRAIAPWVAFCGHMDTAPRRVSIARGRCILSPETRGQTSILLCSHVYGRDADAVSVSEAYESAFRSNNPHADVRNSLAAASKGC